MSQQADGGFEIQAQQSLTKAGLRLTNPRKAVIAALSNAQRPLNAYAIHRQIVGEGGTVDVVSVYRTLEVLNELGLVHFVPASDGFLPCHLGCDHGTGIEHLVCDTCGSVEEVELPDCATGDIRDQLKSHGFVSRRVTVQVEGTCKQCQQTAPSHQG